MDRLPERGEIDLVRRIAQDFALEVQCAFMGWPDRLHEPLRLWTRRNSEAALKGHRETSAAVPLEFDGYIRDLLRERRETGEAVPDDVATRLMRERVEGRPIEDEEIVSIIRNFTVGELATISASVGIIAQYLSEHPDRQARLRSEPDLLPRAIDEIRRIHAPLIANRRVATKPVEIAAAGLRPGSGSR